MTITLLEFHPTSDPWVAIAVDHAASDEAIAPWTATPIIGWALVESIGDDGERDTRIEPVTAGGRAITWGDNYIAVYRREDLGDHYIREQLITLCARARAHRAAQIREHYATPEGARP